MTDKTMAQILAEMSLLSYGAVQRYDKSRGEGTQLAPQGESKPEHEYWAEAYERAQGDVAKEITREAALASLESIKRRPKPAPPVDPEKARWDRITSETHGSRDVDVAFAYGVSLTRLHRARKQRNQDPLDGTLVGPSQHGREDVVRLRQEGRSVRQIAMLTNLSKSHVHRLLGET
jgi:hypothetical protein